MLVTFAAAWPPPPLPTCSAGTVQNTNYVSVAGTSFSYNCPTPQWLCEVSLTQNPTTKYIDSVQAICCPPDGSSPNTWSTQYTSTSRSSDSNPTYYSLTETLPFQTFTYSSLGFSFPGYQVYGDISGSKASVFQTSCPANQYITGIYGATSQNVDQVSGICNYLCIACAPGTYAAAGASACQYCPSGTYDATTGGGSSLHSLQHWLRARPHCMQHLLFECTTSIE